MPPTPAPGLGAGWWEAHWPCPVGEVQTGQGGPEGEAPGPEVGNPRLSRPVSASVSGDLKPCRGSGAPCVSRAIIVTFTCSLCASLFFPVQTPQCQRGLCVVGRVPCLGGCPSRRSNGGCAGETGDPAVNPSRFPLADRKAALPHAGAGALSPECAHLRVPCERARAPAGAPGLRRNTASQESEAAGQALRTGAGASLTGVQSCAGRRARLGEGCVPPAGLPVPQDWDHLASPEGSREPRPGGPCSCEERSRLTGMGLQWDRPGSGVDAGPSHGRDSSGLPCAPRLSVLPAGGRNKTHPL